MLNAQCTSPYAYTAQHICTMMRMPSASQLVQPELGQHAIAPQPGAHVQPPTAWYAITKSCGADDDDDDDDEALEVRGRRQPLSAQDIEAQRDAEAIREVEQSSKKRQKCGLAEIRNMISDLSTVTVPALAKPGSCSAWRA